MFLNQVSKLYICIFKLFASINDCLTCQVQKPHTHFPYVCIRCYLSNFCLRPLAKHQGTTRTVVVASVVLFHLPHFLLKRNLSEKNSSRLGFKPKSLYMPVNHSISWDIVTLIHQSWKIINLTFKSQHANLVPVPALLSYDMMHDWVVKSL